MPGLSPQLPSLRLSSEGRGALKTRALSSKSQEGRLWEPELGLTARKFCGKKNF